MSQAGKALDRSSAVRRVLAGLLVANILVLVAKASIGVIAGSLAVIGDAIHSSADAVYNVLGLVVVRVASREPDEEHPYGHGKFETLGALGIVVFLSVTCVELVRSAVGRLISGGHSVQMTDLGLVLLLATLATNVFVHRYGARAFGPYLFWRDNIPETELEPIEPGTRLPGGLEVLYDGRGRSETPVWIPDRRALVFAEILLRVVPVLVDERAVPAPSIRETAQAVEGVKDAYGIRSRGGNAGVRYAEVTIAVDSAANVADAHAIADKVEKRLKKDLELEVVTVHVEPC